MFTYCNRMKECPVCYESLDDRIRITLPCSHEMCLHCLNRLRKPQTCPMCRTSIVRLLPDEKDATTTMVTLNVSSSDDIMNRIRVAEQLAYAVTHMGAAPCMHGR